MNNKDFDSQSESILLLRARAFKEAGNNTTAYNKQNIIVHW